MHELSIAQSLIDVASQAASDEGSDTVTRLNIRVGLLCGVVKDALFFSFELAAEGTACSDAELSIEEVPVTVHCPDCEEAKTLVDTYHFCCPTCGAPTPKILTGQELDLVSIEIESTQEIDDVAASA